MGRTSTERLLKSQGLTRLHKLRRTRMTTCTYNARTLALEPSVEDLMMLQARKIKYDVIGLIETRRHHPLHAAYVSGEELFLKTCENRVVCHTSLCQAAHLRVKRCSSVTTSDHDDEEVEAFYVEQKFYNGDHTFYEVVLGDFNAKNGPCRSPEELHIRNHALEWSEQGEGLSEFITSTKTKDTV